MSYPHSPGFESVDTSVTAAASVTESASSMRSRIKRHILWRTDATCDEVERALGLRHQTASARIRELVRKRKTTSGRDARVYVVKAAAS